MDVDRSTVVLRSSEKLHMSIWGRRAGKTCGCGSCLLIVYFHNVDWVNSKDIRWLIFRNECDWFWEDIY